MNLDIERTELREFTAGVHEGTARSLILLRDIESTLRWLERMTGQLKTDAVFAEKMSTDLVMLVGVLDPDDSIQASLQSAQQDVEALHTLLIEKRQHGRNDHQLTDDDGIEDAYTEAIVQAADLHNAINSLRWNIGEHDIDAEPHTSDPAMVASTPAEIDALFNKILAE